MLGARGRGKGSIRVGREGWMGGLGEGAES